MRVRYLAAALTSVAISACAANDGETAADTAADSSATSERGTAGMPGMASMPGMEGMATGGDTATAEMRAHMAAMEGVRGDSLMQMAQMHRQMGANMVARFSREMSQMNMPDDPKWRATLDSVRQDLARMPELSAEEMGRTMPAHRARMTRLMEMHRSMMAGMKK